MAAAAALARGCYSQAACAANQYGRAAYRALADPAAAAAIARMWVRAKRNTPAVVAVAAVAAVRASRRPAAGARKQPRRKLRDRGARTTARGRDGHARAHTNAHTGSHTYTRMHTYARIYAHADAGERAHIRGERANALFFPVLFSSPRPSVRDAAHAGRTGATRARSRSRAGSSHDRRRRQRPAFVSRGTVQFSAARRPWCG